jgi:hypothetical protein
MCVGMHMKKRRLPANDDMTGANSRTSLSDVLPPPYSRKPWKILTCRRDLRSQSSHGPMVDWTTLMRIGGTSRVSVLLPTRARITWMRTSTLTLCH